MRNSRIFIVLIGILSLALVACEEPVSVEIPQHERQIVPRGFFAPDSLWQVEISSSVGFLEKNDPFPLANAIVEIWEDGSLRETLMHDEYGKYLGSTSVPIPGKNYMLKISAPGYNPTTAEATLPEVAVTPEIEVTGVNEDNQRTLTNVDITLHDPPGVKNYYAIDAIVEDFYVIDEDTTFFAYPFWFETRDIVLLSTEGVESIDLEAVTFDSVEFGDDLFDGETQTIQIRLENYNLGSETERLSVRVRVTSEEYFRYQRTLRQQYDNEGNPFSQPVRIYSNNDNGFGIFAGYQMFTKNIVE